jgi:hypothetical protein
MNRLLEDYDDVRRQTRYPHTERILIAMRLARDLQTCVALLNGEPVDPDRLDADEVRRAKQRELVRLDFHAIDLLDAA